MQRLSEGQLQIFCMAHMYMNAFFVCELFPYSYFICVVYSSLVRNKT